MMKTKKIFFLFVGLFVMFSLVFLTAWGWKKKTKQQVFVMVPKLIHPYYVPCYDGFKDACEKYGIKPEYEAPAKGDLALQVKVIEDLIVRGVDGIAISALEDEGLIAVVDEAVKAGIKVLTFDAGAPSTKSLSYIGTDNEQAGYAAGKKIAEILKGQSGEVVLLQGQLGATNLNSRAKGFKEALAKYNNGLKVVAVEDIKSSFDGAMNKTEAVLSTYSNLKVVFGVSAYGAPGAAAVMKEQGRNDILVAGFDDLSETLDAIRSDLVDFCIVQKTYKMGWLSVERLIDAVNGKEIPKNIDTGVLFVEKENVDSYMDDMKKEIRR